MHALSVAGNFTVSGIIFHFFFFFLNTCTLNEKYFELKTGLCSLNLASIFSLYSTYFYRNQSNDRLRNKYFFVFLNTNFQFIVGNNAQRNF